MSVNTLFACHEKTQIDYKLGKKALEEQAAAVAFNTVEQVRAKAASATFSSLPILCVLEGNCGMLGQAQCAWDNLPIHPNWRYVFFSATPQLNVAMAATHAGRQNVAVVDKGNQLASALRFLKQLTTLQQVQVARVNA